MACMASSSLGPLTPLSKLQIAPSATHLSLQQGGFCQSHALASRHGYELRQVTVVLIPHASPKV